MRRWPHPALSKGEGSKKGRLFKVLSFGEDLGEAKMPCEPLSKRHCFFYV